MRTGGGGLSKRVLIGLRPESVKSLARGLTRLPLLRENRFVLGAVQRHVGNVPLFGVQRVLVAHTCGPVFLESETNLRLVAQEYVHQTQVWNFRPSRLGADPPVLEGARRTGPDVSWVVLADPDGNEFCLLRGAVA